MFFFVVCSVNVTASSKHAQSRSCELSAKRGNSQRQSVSIKQGRGYSSGTQNHNSKKTFIITSKNTYILACVSQALKTKISVSPVAIVDIEKRWLRGLQATSCSNSAQAKLHPNCQQVPDSYPTTSVNRLAIKDSNILLTEVPNRATGYVYMYS